MAEKFSSCNNELAGGLGNVGKKTYETQGTPVDLAWKMFTPTGDTTINGDLKSAFVFIPGWSIKHDAKSIGPLAQAFTDKSGVPTYSVDTSIKKGVHDVLGHEAEAIRQFVEEKGLEEVTIVGNSQGGARGINLVALLQERNPSISVIGLVLLDSMGLYDQTVPQLGSAYVKDMLRTRRSLRHNPPKGTGHEEFDSQNRQYLIDGITGNMRELRRTGTAFPMRFINEMQELVQQSPHAAEVKAPVIIIQGADDLLSHPSRIIPDDILDLPEERLDNREQHLKSTLFPNSPRVRMIVARDMGHHNLMYSRPESVAITAMYFLQQITAAEVSGIVPQDRKYAARKAAVEVEVEAFHQKWMADNYGVDFGWEHGVIGNFDGLVAKDSIVRNLIISPQNIDRPHRELFTGDEKGGFSELRLDQTPREFLAAVDAAAETLEIDNRKLKNIDQQKLLKLYIELRAQGYNNADLDGYLES